MSAKICTFCSLDCKSSDSRPYPTSKSKDRIHNKCLMKKNLSDKKHGATNDTNPTQLTGCAKVKPSIDTSVSLVERIAREEIESKKAINEKKLLKLVEEKALESKKEANGGQFFFDVKAGIAKPHEKKRYLHHKKVCEMAARFDDNGFKEEASGRAYDHSGKDLNSISDSDDSSETDIETEDKNLSETVAHEEPRKRKPDLQDRQESRKRQSRLKVDDRNPCWFCLSSPKVEKHLILAIGEHCYLTLAKGGLTEEHLLILPIEHIQSLNSREDNSPELITELEQFKKSLIKYFQTFDKGVVFFERNFRSVHWQLQVVPVPIEVVNNLEEKIKSLTPLHFKGSEYIDIPTKCTIRDVIPPTVPYFYWQIEPTSTSFVMQIHVKGSYFPIQLGRIILSDPEILDCQSRVDWQSCTLSEDDYRSIVGSFKEKYKEFDIT